MKPSLLSPQVTQMALGLVKPGHLLGEAFSRSKVAKGQQVHLTWVSTEQPVGVVFLLYIFKLIIGNDA